MATRIERVLAAMKEQGLTQMVVSDPRSIWYLTGVEVEPYERLFAFLLKEDGSHTFFVNRLFHVEQDRYAEVWFDDIDDSIGMMAEHIGDGLLGIDKTWAARFLIPLMERCPKMKPVLASDYVDDCRAIKDEEEKERMREASRINDEVILMAKDFVKTGMTEKEVAAFIEEKYMEMGCEGTSFATIVSFGANAADPHHTPDDTVLQENQCVLFDMGCKKDHYCSDMTRTYMNGEAEPEFEKIYELVRLANEAAEQLVKPGVPLCDIDAAARNVIAEGGYGPYFTHRLGHFIGQEDHEKGDVSSVNQAVAKEGMIFSIEPGIYLPGKFGVRIEDLVLVTKDGCELLNHVDKTLQKI